MTEIKPLREIERLAIIAALNQLEDNMTHAAKALGIARATLYRKCKKHGIEVVHGK